ncbi:MAG: Rab family GTPase [Candidatus Heimdallarchaeota archaeon]
MFDAIFKVVIFGDAGCGKTTLTQRFLTTKFIPNTYKTIGVDFDATSLSIDGFNVKLMIWDFGGEKSFRFLFPQYVLGAMGGVMMYDITNQSSLYHLSDWLSIISESKQIFPIILVGGKTDLENQRKVSFEKGENSAKLMGLDDFIECSSKTGVNIEKVFNTLTRLMLKNINLEEIPNSLPIPNKSKFFLR